MNAYAFPPIIGFEEEKAAQVCAFFCRKAGKRIHKLKLIKLVYLSERRFLAEYGSPIIWDELYSLPHGPICSSTLNGIDGLLCDGPFKNYIKADGRKDIYLVKDAPIDFDFLSDAEIDNLDKIWGEFGHMTASQIRNFTHEYCKEYTELDHGRAPISYRDVLIAVGYEDPDAAESYISEMRSLETIRA